MQASPVAQMVKNLPAIQETQVRSQNREDSLEKEMEIYSTSPAYRIPWTEEPGELQPMGSQRVRHNGVISLTCIQHIAGIRSMKVHVPWEYDHCHSYATIYQTFMLQLLLFQDQSSHKFNTLLLFSH